MKIQKESRQLAITSLAVLAVLLTSLSWALADTSPPVEEWNRTLGGPSYEYGYSVRETSDGGYIITGYTSSYGAGGGDVYLVKADSTGSMEWNTTFGGSNTDYGYSVQETSDGGYIIAGDTSSYGAGYGDVYLVKTDSDGNLMWNKTFGGSGWDLGRSVQETSDGGYIIAGTTESFGAGGSDVYLVKTDSDGNLMWNRTFGWDSGDLGHSVQETSDGGYIIAGATSSYGAGGSDVYLVKTDSTGSMEWSTTFGDSESDGGYYVQETSDGGYIIAGETYSFSASGYDVYLVKTDSHGSEEWNTTFGGSDRDVGWSVQETSDGGYIITGRTYSFGAGGQDVYLVKTDSTGSMEWNTTFGGSEDDWGRSVQETSDGGYIIAGWTMSFGAGLGDVYLVKVDSQEMEEETYSASVVSIKSPSEVFVGEVFTVETTVSYEFTVPTEMSPGIYDVETETWLAEEYETLVGEGTQTYSFELTAPDEAMTWELEADVYYMVDEVWIYDEGSSITFPIEVVAGLGEETYSASIVNVEAPSEVYVGEVFTVEVTVSYEFTIPTEMSPGIFHVETETWLAEEYETLVGEGTQTYSFELTAPDEAMTWELEADVFYLVGDSWLNDGDSWFEPFDIQVIEGGAEETYSALVVDVEAPSEVFTGASFTVEFTVSYEFTIPTEMNPRIYDVETETWIAEEYETLVGEGTQTYSFELTAPEEETTWSLEADVWYNVEDEWAQNEEGSWEAFEVSVVEEGGGWEIPGFPYLSIAMGLILVLLLRDRLHI